MKTKPTAIHLVGPGGAGKSTTGAALASELHFRFVDLDLVFLKESGDIDDWITGRGYTAYARENFTNYLEVASATTPVGSSSTVFAMSSGFMTYSTSIHPAYEAVRNRIENDPSAFVLLPSLTRERCVVETVRRQMSRRHLRPNATREEEKIRRRFDLYSTLKVKKVSTMRPTAEIVAEIIAAL